MARKKQTNLQKNLNKVSKSNKNHDIVDDYIVSLKQSLEKITNGDLSDIYNVNYSIWMTGIAISLINASGWREKDRVVADLILKISNILYNNTSMDVLPLDDGIYDQLVVQYSKLVGIYHVKATPVKFQEIPENQIEDAKIMCQYVDSDTMDSNLYTRELWLQHTPINEVRMSQAYNLDREPISKRLINTTHKYPELVGTLDKCKFVLNADAIAADAFKPSVNVFERDFIHKCLDKGVIFPNEKFYMVGELKYDGVSVEAEVKGDTIIAALSRGDTSDNIATDLTPIFGGYKFPHADKVPKDLIFGIKFEAVITKFNLDRLSRLRGKSYKNCRNAIIGLLGASDAFNFVEFITLIPLSSSLDLPRLDEIKFLNTFYNSGEYNRYSIFYGDYPSILFQVEQFTKSAEIIRKILPYMIDGVVISFIDKNKINTLGRVGAVNKYSIAIKFNPREVRTYFTGYTYNIGKSGEVIPMVHFNPCEFIGGIHTKQTIHSYARFKELGLAIGDIIEVKYINDVITYITKPDIQHNRIIRPKEKFIENCPYCGSKIIISKSGKSAYCPNINCHERKIMRMVDMVDRLGFKDFGEETVRQLNIISLHDLLFPYGCENFSVLGPVESKKFLDYSVKLHEEPINDYRLMSALSFDGMADEKWKLILKHYTIKQLSEMTIDFATLQNVISILKDINGIGDKVAEAVINGFWFYRFEIRDALQYMKIIDFATQASMPKVVFTGFRDQAFANALEKAGYSVSTGGVTKDTFAVIAANPGENSTKLTKARNYGIRIFSRDDFLKIFNIVV